MAINAQILSKLEIPGSYIESLPKNGRSSLGDSIYKSIKVEFFDPEQFLPTMDLSAEHKVLDVKNRIEASISDMDKEDDNKYGKSHWGGMAFTVLSRIEDVLYADSSTQDPSLAEIKSGHQSKVASPLQDDDASNSAETPSALTLSDFMGWNVNPTETTSTTTKNEPKNSPAVASKGDNEKIMTKLANIVTQKKVSYLENIENLSGLRSPTSRH